MPDLSFFHKWVVIKLIVLAYFWVAANFFEGCV